MFPGAFFYKSTPALVRVLLAIPFEAFYSLPSLISQRYKQTTKSAWSAWTTISYSEKYFFPANFFYALSCSCHLTRSISFSNISLSFNSSSIAFISSYSSSASSSFKAGFSRRFRSSSRSFLMMSYFQVFVIFAIYYSRLPIFLLSIVVHIAVTGASSESNVAFIRSSLYSTTFCIEDLRIYTEFRRSPFSSNKFA